MAYPTFYVEEGDTLPIFFDTFDGGTGASITLTGLAVTDVEIYKDGSVTQRASDAGYTLLDTDGIDFDGVTGIHGFSIDLSDNTDSGFYAVGSWYHVVVSSVTIDAQTVNFVAAAFRIVSATRGLAGTALPAAAADAAGGLPISDAGGLDLDAKIGALTFTVAGDVDVNVQTWGGTAIATPPAVNATQISGSATAADNVEVVFSTDFATAYSTASDQWVVSASAVASVTGAVGSVTGAVGSVTGAVGSVTGAVGSVTGNVGGNVTGSVGSVATGGISAASFAAGAIDAAAIAADAIGASELASDAVTEIQSGLATASALSSLETRLRGLVMAQGTIGSTGNSTTALHLDGLTYGNDEINNCLLVIFDVSESEYHARWVEDWVLASELATVATLPFTPQDATDTYWLLPVRQDVTGGSGLDAAGVRAAVGLASANLDTQLSTIDSEVGVIDGIVDDILADTNELQTDDYPARFAGIEGATFATATDSLEALRNRGDAAWVTATGFSTLDAAGVRTAVGLATANLDTQLADLPTVAEFEARTVAAATYATAANLAVVAGYLDTEIAGLITSVADLPTNAELATALGTADDAVLAAIAALNNLSAAQVNAEADTALSDYGALRPTTAGRTLDVTATGAAGIDWANVENPTTTLALTGTTVATTQQVDVNTIKTQTVTCGAGVTVLASVGTAATSTAQTGDSYAIVSSGTHGNSALKTLIDAVDAVVDLILADTGTDGVVVADLSAAICNKVADHVRRRTQANVEASSDGDTLSLGSEYGFIQQAQESSVSGTTMTVKKTDGSTTLGTKTLTTDDTADPVTGIQ